MANSVKLDFSAFRAYRQTPEVQAMIHAEAERIAQNANASAANNGAGKPLYEATGVLSESKGSVVLVSTSNTAARLDNARHNTLLKAVR